MAMSSGLPVVWTAPPVIRLSTEPRPTPRPTCAALDPPLLPLGAAGAAAGAAGGGCGPAVVAARRGGAALQLVQGILERDARRLVAERVDVRDVVCGDIEHRLVLLEAADRGEHASHHEGICSFWFSPPGVRRPA